MRVRRSEMPIDSAAGALHVVALFLAGGRQLPPPRPASPTPSRRGSAGRCRPRRRKRYRNERMTAYWARRKAGKSSRYCSPPPRIANTCSTHQERSRRFPGGARRRGRSATSTLLPQVDVRPYYRTQRRARRCAGSGQAARLRASTHPRNRAGLRPRSTGRPAPSAGPHRRRPDRLSEKRRRRLDGADERPTPSRRRLRGPQREHSHRR